MLVLNAHEFALAHEGSKFLAYYEVLLNRVEVLFSIAPLFSGLCVLVVVTPALDGLVPGQRRWLVRLGLAVAALLTISMVGQSLVNSPRAALDGYLPLNHFWLLLLVCSCSVAIWQSGERLPSAWLLVLFFGFAFALFGTTNPWYRFGHIHAGLTACTALAFAGALAPSGRTAAGFGLAFIAAWQRLVSVALQERFPYRLAGPLAEASVEVDFSPALGAMYVTPKDAEPYLAATPWRAAVHKTTPEDGQAPPWLI